MNPGGPGLCLFGGSFNPPHQTHRRIAAAALLQLPVSALRVLPAGDHPHKQDRDMAPAAHRLAMARLLFASLQGVEVDDRELRRPGPSFTVDTLQEIRAEQPARPLFLLIGSDNLPLLPTWRHHHRLLELATVATYPRRGHAVTAEVLAALDLTAPERDDLLRHVLVTEPDDVSATALRAALRQGRRDLPELGAEVEDYIRRHHLYGT